MISWEMKIHQYFSEAHYHDYDNSLPPTRIYIFTHSKLCLAAATHNFKWMKIIIIVFNLRQNIYKYWGFNIHLTPNNCDFNVLIQLRKKRL